MPCIAIPIDPIGPVLEIGIAAPRSQLAQGAPPPQIHWIKAIADTGCSHTSIQTSVAAKIGLNIVSKGSASTPGGNVAVNLYLGDLFLRPMIGTRPFEFRFGDRGLSEMVNPNPHFEALLGMDILNFGVFVVNGMTTEATFCW